MRYVTTVFLASLLVGVMSSANIGTQVQANSRASSKFLDVGSWWALNEIVDRTAKGTGIDAGTWTRHDVYNLRFAVTSSDGNSLVVSYNYTDSWSSTASDTWVQPNGGRTNKGTVKSSMVYTVDLATLMVRAVSDKNYQDSIGHFAWFMAKPENLNIGSTVLRGWDVPSSDSKTSVFTDVPWNIDMRTIDFKGSGMSVWALTYTGGSYGYWRVGDVHSTGQETETFMFDPTYGIYLGGLGTGTYGFTRSNGGWTETKSYSDRLTDTNLAFSVLVVLGAEPSDVTLTVDGATYSGSLLPNTFYWDPGSTHTLQVDAAISGGPGVRYVFVQWSDGSKETSRTITVSQSLNLNATFRTQYELTLVSEFGVPEGAGWYDAGSQTRFSVQSSAPGQGILGQLGERVVFQRWKGDVVATSPDVSVNMDGPKVANAEWVTDDSQPYMLLGGIAGAIVIAMVVAFLMLRRRAAREPPPRPYVPQVPVPAAAPLPLPASVPQMPQPPPGMKFCIFCGRLLPGEARFCANCQKSQE